MTIIGHRFLGCPDPSCKGGGGAGSSCLVFSVVIPAGVALKVRNRSERPTAIAIVSGTVCGVDGDHWYSSESEVRVVLYLRCYGLG